MIKLIETSHGTPTGRELRYTGAAEDRLRKAIPPDIKEIYIGKEEARKAKIDFGAAK